LEQKKETEGIKAPWFPPSLFIPGQAKGGTCPPLKEVNLTPLSFVNVPLPMVLFNSARNATVHADPKGGGQDDRRFSMGQGCPIEKSRRRLQCDAGLDLQAISFGDFSLGQQRKVTRPRSGRKLCFIQTCERRDMPALGNCL